MDVSELRKRILRALDEARQEASTRRTRVDEARAAYDRFLTEVAVPLLRQSAMVLSAAGQPFQVHTPAVTARLVLDQQPLSFLELELDVSGVRPRVRGRVRAAQPRRGGTRPVHTGAPRRRRKMGEEDWTAPLVEQGRPRPSNTKIGVILRTHVGY